MRTQKKGFTLIELMISIFIFVLVMLAVVTVFARHVSVYKHNRVVQRNVENAQFAMNFMTKTLRTSSIVESSFFTDSIFVYDHSVQKCFIFAFEEQADRDAIAMQESEDSYSDPSFCSTAVYEPSVNLTTGNVVGQFYAVTTLRPDNLVDPPEPAVIGRVTIALEVDQDGDGGQLPINLQSTVSLRDYPAELSF